MRVLVIGSGGREHALVWKISQSKLVDKIFCAPGNGGIAKLAECLSIKADDIFGLLDFARKEKIDLTVVGPEVALALGIVDEFIKAGLKIFGPNKLAANLEASKVFSKELMAKYNVPTAPFKVFDNPDEAIKYLEINGVPCVIKADGLAAGKGVVVAKTLSQAKEAIVTMMQDKAFGAAGEKIIIEECLEGQEASILVITDSKEVRVLASAQDHKRIFDNDQGPNTGGMGAYSPAPIITENVLNEVLEKIIYRTLDGLNKEGFTYQGVLYAGVMLTKNGVQCLEFNVRFGDPETQVILPRLKTDLVEIMLATYEGKLKRIKKLDWDSRTCVCVVCASGGYPGNYQKDQEIFGLNEAEKIEEVIVFHAGTHLLPGSKNSKPIILTSGGRVLGVTALGVGIKDALARVYRAVGKINFNKMHYRKDIASKALI